VPSVREVVVQAPPVEAPASRLVLEPARTRTVPGATVELLLLDSEVVVLLVAEVSLVVDDSVVDDSVVDDSVVEDSVVEDAVDVLPVVTDDDEVVADVVVEEVPVVWVDPLGVVVVALVVPVPVADVVVLLALTPEEVVVDDPSVVDDPP
jgi:hypothetical protein